MKNILRLGTVLVASGLVVGAVTPVRAASPVELRVVSAWPESRFYSKGIFVWMDTVKEMLGKRVKIVYKGGPEVIPAFKQVEGLKNGAIDVVFTTPAYYATTVPQIIVLGFTKYSSKELRANGGIDYMNQILKKRANARLIGAFWNYASATFMTKKVTTMADLKGKKIRTGSFIPFLTALGASPVRMPLSSVYTALDRGVVDGITSPEVIANKSIRKKLKYKVKPTYYDISFNVLINDGVWKKFPKDIQSGLLRAGIAAEIKINKYVAEKVTAANAEAKAEGMKDVVLPEGDKYVKLAYDSAWKFVHKRLPKDAPKLETYFRKTK